MLIAGDAEVIAIPAEEAVAVMAEAVRRHGEGLLVAPPRTPIKLGDGGYAITAGRLPGVANGFRLTSTIAETADDTTLLFDAASGEVGVLRGRDLGRRRTGALGGVAASLLSREDAQTVGVVGAGEQAFTQLWAISAVRDLRAVTVTSRNPATAGAFAERAARELGLAVTVVDTPREAVRDADIVVMATPSASALIESGWIAPGTHVHTLGPKGQTLDPTGVAEGECPRQLVDAADVLVSDSPDQLAAMEGPDQPWTRGRPAISLGEVLTGTAPGRSSDEQVTLYASVGLAGTEVLLARHVLITSRLLRNAS